MKLDSAVIPKSTTASERELETPAACSPEFLLLVDFTRFSDDPVLIKRLGDKTFLASIDWREFQMLASFHRVENLVHHVLENNPDLLVPAIIKAEISALVRQDLFQQMTIQTELAGLSARLQEDGLKHLSVKGLYVADRFYKTPRLRQSIDIDLWIDKRDLAAINAIIKNLGYKQFYPTFDVPPHCEDMLVLAEKSISYVHPVKKTQIDLHWRFHRNRTWLDWDFQEEYEIAEYLEIASVQVPALSRISHIYYIYFHGAISGWFRLKWMADIYRINLALGTEDAHSLSGRVSDENMDRMMAPSIELCRRLYAQTDFPALDLYWQDGTAPELLRYMEEQIRCAPYLPIGANRSLKRKIANIAYSLRLQPGMRHKVQTIFNAWLSHKPIKTLRLSKNWLWLYVLSMPVLFVFDQIKPRR